MPVLRALWPLEEVNARFPKAIDLIKSFCTVPLDKIGIKI